MPWAMTSQAVEVRRQNGIYDWKDNNETELQFVFFKFPPWRASSFGRRAVIRPTPLAADHLTVVWSSERAQSTQPIAHSTSRDSRNACIPRKTKKRFAKRRTSASGGSSSSSSMWIPFAPILPFTEACEVSFPFPRCFEWFRFSSKRRLPRLIAKRLLGEQNNRRNSMNGDVLVSPSSQPRF